MTTQAPTRHAIHYAELIGNLLHVDGTTTRRVLGLMIEETGDRLDHLERHVFRHLALLCKVKAHEDPAAADVIADSWGL